MVNRNGRKQEIRQAEWMRRLIAIFSAFVLLFSSTGTVFAQDSETIYSAPVTAPVRTEAPEETPAPAVTAETEEDGEPQGEIPETDDKDVIPGTEDDAETGDEEPAEDIPASETDGEETDKTPGEESADGNAENQVNNETDQEPLYFPGTLTAETEDGTIQIDYPAIAHIPENAVLTCTAMKGAELYGALKSAAKLIRNEENAVWQRQVADEGKRFWLPVITDADGNEIHPQTRVTVTFTVLETPRGAEWFLAGDNAKLLEEQDGTVTIADYTMDPFGYAMMERVQIGTVTQEYTASDYTVTASYGPEAGFPEDTEMKVREIKPGTPEYALYSGMTEEALGEDWTEITLERYFDITFVSGGEELEPQADVDVQIIFRDVIELTEEHDVQAVHIENQEAVVIESETDSNEDDAKWNSEAIDTVSFTSDSFSVFGVVQRKKITQKVLAADGNTYEINVTYGQEAAIPADAELIVTELLPGDERYAKCLQKAVRAALEESEETEGPDVNEGVYIAEDQYGRFFDIEIRSGDQKIEPDSNVSVAITLADAPEARTDELMVVHFAGEEPDVLSAEINAETSIQFETDSFSVYGVITMPNSQPQNNLGDLDSRTFVMNHNGQYVTNTIDNGTTNQFHKTRNANDATVWTFEATDQAGVYNIFTTDDQGNKLYMHLDQQATNRASAALSSTPQGFGVMRDNNGYVLYTDSNGTRFYLNEFNGGTGFAGWYARNNRDDVFSLEFRDPVMVNGKEYMVLVKYDGNYYIVNNDATLTRVEYDPETNKVAVDNPMLWTVEGNNPNKLIYFRSDAAGFTSDNLPSDYYRRYLDPSVAGATTEENSGNVSINPHYDQAWTDDTGTVVYPCTVNRPTDLQNHARLNYYSQQVYTEPWNANNHFGVELDSNGIPIRLVGQQSADNAVEILFADATEVENAGARNHTVNHIDISIAGESRVTVPLAYGTYYYKDPDTGEWIEYNVTTNTSLDLRSPVAIDPEDMKHASIKAYDKNNNELDDAFVITGYSSNAHTDVSAVQVRVEGRFKVAEVDLDYYAWWEDANSDRMKQARLDNQITYVISAVKNTDFNMVDPDRGQLYEKQADGTYKPLSLNMDVDMTASFTYYDTANECPPVHWNYDLWQSGGIIDGSGMDFILGGDTEAANTNVVALEVTKQIVDENGLLVHPAEKIIHSVDIYGNTAKDANGLVANPNIVAEVNVDQYTTDFVPSGYTKFHSKNIAVGPNGMTVVYDYAIQPGMYYVTEDKSTIAEFFTDTSGDTWEYKETYITTEYVRRGNKYDDKNAYPDPQHYSKNYTMDDPVYASVPEVAGTFKRLDNVEKKNGIVEFYVYNVYVNTSKTSLEAEKKWAAGTPIPDGAEVTLELYYTKRQKTDHGEPVEMLAAWPDYEDYLPVKGDPVFGPEVSSSLTLKANESMQMDWKGVFTALPENWRDSEGNDWELDYYVRETAVTVNGENIIDQFIQTIEKEEPALGNESHSDGKVTITNAADKSHTTVKKIWSDEAVHYEDDTITLKLIRYKKDAPPEPEEGILNISHITSGLPASPQLPDGFTVTYSYSGPVSASGVPAGYHLIPPGRYTVTATVTNGAAPFGYTYSFTSAPVTVNVPENGTATAEFTSFYSENLGTLNITHVSAGLPGSPQLPGGFTVSYTCTGNGSTYQLQAGNNSLPAGTYVVTANVSNNAAPSGYSYAGTTEPVTVTVTASGTTNAEFTSTYGKFVKVTARHIQYRNVNYNIITDVDQAEFAVGTIIEIAYTTRNLTSELYINGTRVTTFRGPGPHAYNYPINSDGDILIEAIDPWYPGGITSPITVREIGASGNAYTLPQMKAGIRPVRYTASTGQTSGGGKRSSGMPEDYNRDDTWEQAVTVSRSEDWTKVVEELEVYDENGQPYYYAVVEENVPSGYDAEESTPIIATEMEELELYVTNTYINPTTGNLIVSKNITGNAADLTKQFEFTVTAVDAEGQPIPDGTYGAMTFNGGTATFTLTNGESVKALELPDGAVYTVSEEADGYVAIREGEDGTIEAGETKRVDFTNTLDTYADLKIAKTVTGEEIDQEKEFTFTVMLDGYTGEQSFEIVKTSVSGNDETGEGNTETGGEEETEYLTFNDGTATITLKHNESLTIKNLPNGTSYSITEQDYTPEYYEPVTEGASGTIAGGENVTVNASFINPKVPVVDIAANKNWGETGNTLGVTAVRFVLKRQAGSEEPEIIDTVTLTADNEWQKYWDGLLKYVEEDEGEQADDPVPYIYSIEETGVYFGELADGEVPEESWITDEETLADMFMTEGGEVTISGDHLNHGTAKITNETESTSVIVEKKWPDFEDDDSYTWSANFQLLADEEPTEDEQITITKNTPVEDRTFANLPKYRIDENGEPQLIDYTVKETAYSVYENGTLRYSYDGTNYIPDDKNQRYLSSYDSEMNENGDEVITVTNVTTKVKSIRVTKEWMGIPYEATKDLPATFFTLGYTTAGNIWGNAEPYQDENGYIYTNISLNYENHWTWECPVELPEENRYFVVEKPLTKTNWDETEQYVMTDPEIDDFLIKIYGYKYREVIDTGNWSERVPYEQPRNANIGSHGEIKIMNELPGYMQMALKKKFLEYRDNGNGGYSLYTTTGESDQMRNMIIELQMMRRTVDRHSGQDVYLTDWQNYGSTVKLGYDATGNEYIDNPNPFSIKYGGSWLYSIEDGGNIHGLPTQGLYKKPDGTIIVVWYQYIYKEVQVYDGNLNPIGDQWTAWLPYAWDGNGDTLPVSELQTAQDWDRMLNAPGTSLDIEKVWAHNRVAANIEEVYVRVERREYGSNGPYEDYLSVISEEMELGSLSQNHFSTTPDVYNRIINRIMLSADNDWKATIDKVPIFPNGNGQKQYEYRIIETGYKDKAGNVFMSTAVFEPVDYFKQGRNDDKPVAQDNGLLLTKEGPNRLFVKNTSQFGPLEIIKQVPAASEEAAAEQSFTFSVELLLPPGETLNMANLIVENGTISDYNCENETATFTLSIQGAGTVLIDGIPFGTVYEVSETSVPKGWKQEGTTVYSDQGKIIENPEPDDETGNETELYDETELEIDTATVTNIEITSIAAEKVWMENGEEIDWPEGIETVAVGLYQSVNGAEPTAVMNGTTPVTISFGSETELADRTFAELPVYDAAGNKITYSIREMSIDTAEDSFTVVDDTVTVTGEEETTWTVLVSDPVEIPPAENDPENSNPADYLVTVTNSTVNTEIHILKIDLETEEPLAGAVFRLDRVTADGIETVEESIAVGEDGEDKGKATITGLTDGTYRIVEKKAPAGYIPLGSPFRFTVQTGTVVYEDTEYVTYDTEDQTFTVRNKAGLALPSTGGEGTLVYTAGGLGMIILAVILFLVRRKKWKNTCM